MKWERENNEITNRLVLVALWFHAMWVLMPCNAM